MVIQLRPPVGVPELLLCFVRIACDDIGVIFKLILDSIHSSHCVVLVQKRIFYTFSQAQFFSCCYCDYQMRRRQKAAAAAPGSDHVPCAS